MTYEAHYTTRWIATVAGVAIIICTLIGSITYYNVQAVQHPIKVESTTTNSTSVERGK